MPVYRRGYPLLITHPAGIEGEGIRRAVQGTYDPPRVASCRSLPSANGETIQSPWSAYSATTTLQCNGFLLNALKVALEHLFELRGCCIFGLVRIFCDRVSIFDSRQVEAKVICFKSRPDGG